MPLISGTMLIYIEWCSVTLKKVFFFFLKKRYQRLRKIYKRVKTMKSAIWLFVFCWKPLSHNLNEIR